MSTSIAVHPPTAARSSSVGVNSVPLPVPNLIWPPRVLVTVNTPGYLQPGHRHAVVAEAELAMPVPAAIADGGTRTRSLVPTPCTRLVPVQLTAALAEPETDSWRHPKW
jgi:hypothetical protein